MPLWMHCEVHLLICFGMSVLILGVDSLETEGEVFCAHESKDVDIVWPNTPKDSSYNVASRAWYKDSNTVVALRPEGMEFIEGPDYKDRLMQIKDTGIKIKAVNKADSGNYVQHTRFESDMNISEASIYLLVTDAATSVCKPWISQDGLFLKAHLPSDYVCAALRLEWKYANKTVTTQSHRTTLQLGTDSGETEYMVCAVGEAVKCFEGNISDLCTNYTVSQHPKSGDGVTLHPVVFAVSIACIVLTIIVTGGLIWLRLKGVICQKSYGEKAKPNAANPHRTAGEGADQNEEDPFNPHGEGAELNATDNLNPPGARNKPSVFQIFRAWLRRIAFGEE